jgi:hypothetical protein
METYKAILESDIQNVPCKIGVMTFHVTKPWRGNLHDCPSDYDYYGGTEVEFEVLKMNGTPYPWLQNRLTWKDEEDIKREIIEYFEDSEPDCDNYGDRYDY